MGKKHALLTSVILIAILGSATTATAQPYICGDADGSGVVEVADAVFLISYIFVPGSPAPDPYAAGDPDCTAVIETADAVYLINYIFVPGSLEPCDPNDDGAPDC
jgi:hypothetical protein